MTEKDIKDLCAEYEKLDSPLIYDALFKKFGLRSQILRHEIKSVLPEMKVVGPALTVMGTAVYKPLEESDKAPLGDMWLRVEEAITPGCVLVVDVGQTRVAVVGDIFAMSWKVCGMQGIVVDGPVRDSKGMIEASIPIFCEYTTPICANGSWEMISGQTPIFVHGELGEVIIHPGDFIFGDSDGVLVIPKDMVKKVLLEAQRIAEDETLFKNAIRNEKLTPRQVMEKFHHKE